MQTTTSSIHNRGTFHFDETAFRAGDSSKDRQSGGENYMPYQQGDQVQFRPGQYWQPEVQQGNLTQFIERVFNLDIRVITSAIAATIFATIFHAAFSAHPALSAVLGLVFFVVWYVMSFFDFARMLNNAQHGPRQSRHSHHQVQATF